MESITITITETAVSGLSVSCKIPAELKNKISGVLAERTMEFITSTMNKLTGETKTISRETNQYLKARSSRVCLHKMKDQ